METYIVAIGALASGHHLFLIWYKTNNEFLSDMDLQN